MNTINRDRINAYLMALFIFQYGFLQPISTIVDSQWPIALFSLALVGFGLIVNGFRFHRISLTLMLGIAAVFCLYSLTSLDSAYVLSIMAECMVKCYPAIIIAGFPSKGSEIYRAFRRLALFNFLSVFWFPFTRMITSVNYMRYGYAMLPSLILFYYAFLYERKKLRYALLSLVALALITVYGSRGPLVAVGLLAILELFYSRKIRRAVKCLIVAITAGLTYLMIQGEWITRFIRYLSNRYGIWSYSLEKFMLQFNGGLAAASSGRDLIYSVTLKTIREHVWFGSGIGYLTMVHDFKAHNIFLQILSESGVIGLLLWVFVWIYLFRQYLRIVRSNDLYLYSIMTALIAISAGRLLISSDYWLRPEYWFSVVLLIRSTQEMPFTERAQL